MSESTDPAIAASHFGGREFYVTGGTLRLDAPCYVERQADKDIFEALSRGDFCYVLTPRQMGKSSLMVRTVQRLRHAGYAVAVLDLTALGQNLTVEQWYDGLMSRLGQQLNLEDELLAFWEAHPEWGPLQRWLSALEQVVLKQIQKPVAIFVDEIDIVRSLPFSSDEFFAAIRECYNRRSREPAFQRLSFALLGVATPTDLIRDTRMTPFNIGRRIDLNDFAGEEALPLAKGLCADETLARRVLNRILFWTGGHPYLTQRLCRAFADATGAPGEESAPAQPPLIPTVPLVDQLASTLFLSRQARDRDDNLIFVRERILRSEGDVAGLLYLYQKIRGGLRVPDNETNPQYSILRLSGITRNINGCLRVRNRIYHQVFDLDWIQTNMPGAEKRRQRKAGRRGIVIGMGIGVALIVAYLLLGPVIQRSRDAWFTEQTIRGLETTYRQFQTYQDQFETTVEIGLGSTMVPVAGSGSLLFEKPARTDLAMKSSLTTPAIEVRYLSDGQEAWMVAPTLNQYQSLPTGPRPGPLKWPEVLAEKLGPMRVLPFYRLFLMLPPNERPLREAQHVKLLQHTRLDGLPVAVLNWDMPPTPLLRSLRVPPTQGFERIPITVWVDPKRNVVVKLRVDLSPWAKYLVESSDSVAVTGLVITETHKNIAISQESSAPGRFVFRPPFEAARVESFDLPDPDLNMLASGQRKFARYIPARLPQTPPNLIDLTPYYNASLVEAWHPGSSGNNLDILPSGLLQLSGVVFDVRGIVQVSGRELQNAGGRYPLMITGIRIGQTCRQLHFLHAAGWRASDGALLGQYVLHYANGQERSIPIVYGEDVRDWNAGFDKSSQLKRATQVWSATNKSNYTVRLFKSTWENPFPDIEIISLDYVSAMGAAAPFLIAITADP